jgi:monoamine oxidase
VVLVPAPGAAERWAREDTDRVRAEALPAAEQVLPGITSAVEEARLFPWPDGVWLPEPGYFRRLGDGEPTLSPRLALAGAYRVAPTVEGAVRSGIRAAEKIISAAV